ncbi:penicillin amidase, partial [Planctomyces bekefii]
MLLTALGGFYASIQGSDGVDWEEYGAARISFDGEEIPTIVAPTWEAIIEAQGFTVAASRLWQMDLIRRKAGGRLAEWFGEAASAHDVRVASEDRLWTANEAVKDLPDSERIYCELYARGVNRFIDEYRFRWGLEYALLRTEPEPWSCMDSILVMIEMASDLSSIAKDEVANEVWRRNLSTEWQAFLFPEIHPWNRPLIGPRDLSASSTLPPPNQYIPRSPINEKQLGAVSEPVAVGSNNWAWTSAAATFVANDPHLGNTVPQIWYPMRLRVSETDWVVGTALPGVPGVVLGMNPSLAWSFTNSGEDVDDYLREEIDDQGKNYLLTGRGESAVWAPLERKKVSIRVRGEREARSIEVIKTRRGPLTEQPELGPGKYSRQWLPLKRGMLRLSIMKLIRAESIEAMNEALDDLRTPSQNVVFADRMGRIAYRLSGVGIKRSRNGRRPMPATDGEWLGYEPQSLRPRTVMTLDGVPTRHIATANDRVVAGRFEGFWASDDRRSRIDELLSSSGDLKLGDMKKIQLDTTSRFRKKLGIWIANRSEFNDESGRSLVQKFRDWSGSSRDDPKLFALTTVAEDHMTRILLGRVSAQFPTADAKVAYRWFNRRAWLTQLLELNDDDAWQVFGLTSKELAQHTMNVLVEKMASVEPHHLQNLFRGQHPFFERVPLLGHVFAVDRPPQWGASDLIDAQQPLHGPSFRGIYDLRDARSSLWSFPVGVSGHAVSGSYSNFQKKWVEDQMIPMLGGPHPPIE